MNWDRGLKRAAYVFLAIVWVGVLLIVASDGPAVIGETVVYLLIFTVVFMLLYAAIRWVVQGFRRS